MPICLQEIRIVDRPHPSYLRHDRTVSIQPVVPFPDRCRNRRANVKTLRENDSLSQPRTPEQEPPLENQPCKLTGVCNCVFNCRCGRTLPISFGLAALAIDEELHKPKWTKDSRWCVQSRTR